MAAEERFEVEYSYYQYNSGAADNGHYRRSIVRADATEALALAAEINRLAAVHKDGSEDSLQEEERERAYDLRRELIPWDGYFTGARALHVVSTAITS